MVTRRQPGDRRNSSQGWWSCRRRLAMANVIDKQCGRILSDSRLAMITYAVAIDLLLRDERRAGAGLPLTDSSLALKIQIGLGIPGLGVSPIPPPTSIPRCRTAAGYGYVTT
jgi:hypothetical protein